MRSCSSPKDSPTQNPAAQVPSRPGSVGSPGASSLSRYQASMTEEPTQFFPTDLEPLVDVRCVRILLAACVAPPYLYYSVLLHRNPLSLLTAACALGLFMSQRLTGAFHHGYVTPLAGALLNASAICTTGYERSPFLFLILIPLLTYSVERDAVWVLRSVMLNTILMTFLIARSVARADWFGLANVLGLLAGSHVACRYIRQSKDRIARIVETRTEEAHVDPLTGLYNRRALDKMLSCLIAASRPFALVLCDIDGFKWYNDTFGHLAGDRVLQAAARMLTNLVSPRGQAFRWGGDEFVLILPGGDRTAADSAGKKMGGLIATEFQRLGLSFGVSVFPDDGSTPEELFGAGDRMLYSAKDLAAHSGNPATER